MHRFVWHDEIANKRNPLSLRNGIMHGYKINKIWKYLVFDTIYILIVPHDLLILIFEEL